MTSHLDIWRQRIWLWLVPLLFFVLNATVFGFYRFAYASKADVVQVRIERESRDLEKLAADRERIAQMRERIEVNHAQVEELRDVWFSTEAARFTRTIARIKTLVRDAGLAPLAYSYPSSPIADQDLVRYDFGFQVDGTYEQIRRFVNFLELTEDFIIVEEISLDDGNAASGDPRLRVRFLLSTVFVNEGAGERSAS